MSERDFRGIYHNQLSLFTIFYEVILDQEVCWNNNNIFLNIVTLSGIVLKHLILIPLLLV